MSRIRWPIVEKVYDKTKVNFCPLWLAEKVHFIENFESLNTRSKFISGCRHQAKLSVKSFSRKYENNLAKQCL